jgi:nucleoid-associated protein EbfC
MKDIRLLMKQAQQMQARMAELQEKLQTETVEATAGGGMVTAVMNGKHELLSLKINPQAVDPDDVSILEDMILGAVNEAARKAEERMQSEMQKVTGGMNLPGMF